MKPRILVLAKSIKSYWATPYAQKRVRKIIALRNESWPVLFFEAVAGWMLSKKYDLVIAADSRIGTIYGLIRNLFGGRTPILLDQLILPDNDGSLMWNIKNFFEKIAFKSIEVSIVNSSFEKEQYKKRLHKDINFVYLPIPAEDFWYKKSLSRKRNNYIFSGGGEKRDFKSLFEIASKIKQKIKIATFSKKDLEGIQNIPANCEIIYNAPNQDYISLIGNSLFVVIPLKKTSKSAGQTTLVQAMCQGKAVVIADNPALSDYIKESAVFYEPENRSDLLAKINLLLKNRNLREELGKNAIKTARKMFTYNSHDKRMGEIIDLCLKH